MRLNHNQAIRIVAGHKDAGRKGRHLKTFTNRGVTWHVVLLVGKSEPELFREGQIAAVSRVEFRSQSIKHTIHVTAPKMPQNRSSAKIIRC